MPKKVGAQNIIVNTATLEGLDITPYNMFNFQVQSLATTAVRCKVDGKLIYRNSDHVIRYSFYITIKPGINIFDQYIVSPTWSFSSPALKELFTYHQILPQGTYQYCITVTPEAIKSDQYAGLGIDDCVFKQAEDIFSITLLEPENDAKLYEYNPMFNWVATYPFASELTYKIRIAEIKNGQNTESAIARNNPVYSENNLFTNTIVYPIYGKPLIAFQPYSWTVDAYYKGIHLGGAQPWKFTIIEDSLLEASPNTSSYIDINIDEGKNIYRAIGKVKIKYSENDFLQNEINLEVARSGKKSKTHNIDWVVKRGVNFNTWDVSDFGLKHNEEFELIIKFENSRTDKKVKVVKFKYVNPYYVK